MVQHGFFFDQSRCSGCQTCSVACKINHALPPGPLKYLRVYQYEKGAFPIVRIHHQWIPCYHCENPICVNACPTGAIKKEESFGAVLVSQEDCNGCRSCYDACPYGAPVFESNEKEAKAQKCDMCIDRLRQGDSPVCILACPLRALDFGPLHELEKTYGQGRDLEDLPSRSTTRPSVLFKPSSQRKQLFPYDADRALELFMKRDPLPQVFGLPSDVTNVTPGLVGRDRLVIKHASGDDVMRATCNDDG